MGTVPQPSPPNADSAADQHNLLRPAPSPELLFTRQRPMHVVVRLPIQQSCDLVLGVDTQSKKLTPIAGIGKTIGMLRLRRSSDRCTPAPLSMTFEFEIW